MRYRSATDRVAARYMTAREAAHFASDLLNGLDLIEGAVLDATTQGGGFGGGYESLADANSVVAGLVDVLGDLPFSKIRRQAQRVSPLRMAMDHPTEEARKKYLSEHPNADPKNHSVSRGEKEKSKGEDSSGVGSDAGSLRKTFTDHIEVPGLDGLIAKLPKTFLGKDDGYSHPKIKKFQEAVLKNLTPEQVNKVRTQAGEAHLKMLNWLSRQKVLPSRLPADVQQAHAQMMSAWRGLKDLDPSKAKGGEPAKARPKSGPRKTFSPSASAIVSKHGLKDEDASEIEAFKKSKPDKGSPISDAEKLRRFLQKAKPETRERMKDISPAEFAKLLGAIMDEEGVDF